MRLLRHGGVARRRSMSESGVERPCGVDDGIHQERETGRFSVSLEPWPRLFVSVCLLNLFVCFLIPSHIHCLLDTTQTIHKCLCQVSILAGPSSAFNCLTSSPPLLMRTLQIFHFADQPKCYSSISFESYIRLFIL